MRNGFVVLTEDDFVSVFLLESRLTDDVTVVIKSTQDEILKCLRSEMSVGIFVDSQLVAYSLCYGDDYFYASYIEKCVTRDGHGGNGYQCSTINRCKELSKAKGFLRSVAMVSPSNSRSVYNFKRSGFTITRKLYNVFGSINERYLMECKL